MFEKWKEWMGMGRTIEDVKKDGEGEGEVQPLPTFLPRDETHMFDLFRAEVADVGGCDACGTATLGEKWVLGIKAGFPRSSNILLCQFHEGELFKALLWSYLRRLKGVESSEKGFTGPVEKNLPPKFRVEVPPAGEVEGQAV